MYLRIIYKETMKQLMELSETEIRLGFAALCVEATARTIGCGYREMYDRLHRVGLIQQIAKQLNPLHTQSREYVVEDILSALTRLEAEQQKGGDV